jgi:hypothetical protein
MKPFMRIQTVASLALLLTGLSAVAQKSTSASAPLPSQLSSAQTIFLSNACEDDTRSCRGIYDQLYAGLASNAHFRLVTTPRSSDLVLEVHFVQQAGRDWGTVRLIARDPQSRTILWTINEDAHHSNPSAAVQQALADFFAVAAHS